MGDSLFVSLQKLFKPVFWDATQATGEEEGLFNYRRIWKLVVLVVTSVSVIPLVIITAMDYNLNRRAMQAEFIHPMTSLLSNTSLSISKFLQQRVAVLEFIANSGSFDTLADENHLRSLFHSMNEAFGGFVDIGLIDEHGVQRAYVGPFDFTGLNYSEQDWFEEVLDHRIFISDVFLGFRDVPHFVIAVKEVCAEGKLFILRATIDTEQFNRLIHSLNVRPTTDAFVVNRKGVLQTPSQFHGNVLHQLPYPVPSYSENPVVLDVKDAQQKNAFLGYVHISNSPFVFMVVKQQQEMMKNWWKFRLELTGFLVVSVTCIFGVILYSSTFLVRRIYDADIRRSIALHKMEHTNKMASIGRLAAGVAHEINNPLAVINEKAGLIKDLFSFSEKYVRDAKLLSLVDSILSSVDRCSTITHRLLGFARHVDVQLEQVDVTQTLRDVLGFLDKEAQYRNIQVSLDITGQIPEIVTDRGQLQQVFLNIINNAFAAVQDGGRIEIWLEAAEPGVKIHIADNGCGISPDNMKRIFEPFFSTKSKQGTGLGLSITYGLVKKLGGEIHVVSELGQGTTFTVSLPVNQETREEDAGADLIG
ncbi:MAG TPA: sensor histidine kinase [Desulfonatronum sp.]|nr:sensor histidine kinase [Desulfonatronum sp.]